MGFNKVRDECEKIQHYGQKKDATGNFEEPDEQKCLDLIKDCLVAAKAAYKTVDQLMHSYYAKLEEA